MGFSENSNLVIQKENLKTDVKSHIPQELIPPILLLLPVKSLCRFRSVSKSFNALIESPDFVNKQLRRSSGNKTHRKMIFEEIPSKQTSKSTAFRVCDVDDGLEETIIFRKPRSRRTVEPLGYCNGLFLFFHSLLNLVIWNPSTKRYIELPACPLNITHHSDYYNCRLGLGYDSVRDDYKVVLIFQKKASKVWIFGLRSNSWRRIGFDFFPVTDKYQSSSAYFAHGSLHWLDDSPVTGSPEIVAFDVAEEKFSQVLYPAAGWVTGLHVLDGCLCVSFFSFRTKEARLYAGNKNGDDYLWHELCSFTFKRQLFFDMEHFRNVKVVGRSKEGNKIMMHVGLEFLISYDLRDCSFVKINVPSGFCCGNLPVMFTESLVSM